MIRKLEGFMIDDVMEIWLDENITTHDFIDEEYWRSNYQYVKNALSSAHVMVYEDEGIIKGFIGLMDEGYIAGLFVSRKYRNQGIGKCLLDRCKKEYNSLRLHVYEKNISAINFYKKSGFEIRSIEKSIDTGEIEYWMEWRL